MTLTEPAPAVGTAADQASRATLTSVRNAARVLRAFSRAGQELGITELARQLGLSKSTVHRLVTTLTAERLLERGSTPGRYRLGDEDCQPFEAGRQHQSQPAHRGVRHRGISRLDALIDAALLAPRAPRSRARLRASPASPLEKFTVMPVSAASVENCS